jgi:[ribosomal protein S5]-alanine N-acetyltransferase
MNPTAFYQHLPTLHTQRLILRKLRLEDAGDYFAFASDPQVTRFLRWGPHASMAETEKYLEHAIGGYHAGTDGPWGIELAREGRLIGSIHLMEIDPYHLKADVGVVLNSQYWRKSIGSEALRCVLAHCFNALCLQRVQALVITGNIAGYRLMETCGMTHEGVLRRYALQKGMWRDFDVFSILPEAL